MEVLITQEEEKLLKNLLALAPMPEITLSYQELRGYLYGIAITPDLIPPSEWVPVIFGDGVPEYENEEQAQQLMEALLYVLNKHISGFQDGTLFIPIDIENLSEQGVDEVWEWTSGLEEALSLRPDCWEEDQEGLNEEEKDHLMYSLIVIEGVVHPDEAMDMFDQMPKSQLAEIGVVLAKNETERVMQVQVYLLQALAMAVETIQNHGATLELKRRGKLRSTSVPFPVRSSKVGKNENCPCGSKRKYLECCGKKTQEKITLHELKSHKGKGKVIQGDFPQHRRKTAKKQVVTDSHAQIYQLEITLAYVEPSIWRRVQIPGSMTLADLHKIIQLCMGWQDMHMHQFQVGAELYGPLQADDYSGIAHRDESDVKLSNLEKQLLQGILYTYDFGDDWEHVIMLEKVVPKSEAQSYPVLLDGKRACPPEDIGGVPGYQDLLEALVHPEKQDTKEMIDLSYLEGYEPGFFEKDDINKILNKIYG